MQLAEDGARSEAHVCLGCQQKLGLQPDREPFDVAMILAGAETKPSDESRLVRAVAETETGCPACGLTPSEHQVNHLFGCPVDYDSFGKHVASMLKRYHGSDLHLGRGPVGKNGTDTGDLERHRIQLEQELREAIAQERFEEAARLRDRLRGAVEPGPAS